MLLARATLLVFLRIKETSDRFGHTNGAMHADRFISPYMLSFLRERECPYMQLETTSPSVADLHPAERDASSSSWCCCSIFAHGNHMQPQKRLREPTGATRVLLLSKRSPTTPVCWPPGTRASATAAGRESPPAARGTGGGWSL